MVNRKIAEKAILKVKFDGPAIHDGRILYDDLSVFVSNVSLAIDRILNIIQTGASIKKGRPFKATQLLSALEIVSIRRGSFQLSLDLRREEQLFPGWDMGERAVDILVRGLQAIQKDGQLPEEYDAGVMIALRDAGRIMDRGVESVSLNSSTPLGNIRAKYTSPTRESIISHLHRLEYGFGAVEGRLLMLDAEEGKLICRIRPSTGDPILCRFEEDMTDQVVKNIRQFVHVKGEVTYDSDTSRITAVHVRDIEPIEESGAGNVGFLISSFWKGHNFSDLAATQGVYPADNWGKLSADWPKDTDFDSFLEAVRSARD
jgi:hypothetical protein